MENRRIVQGNSAPDRHRSSDGWDDCKELANLIIGARFIGLYRIPSAWEVPRTMNTTPVPQDASKEMPALPTGIGRRTKYDLK